MVARAASAVADAAAYDSAYTFLFSPRPGTPAAEMTDEFVAFADKVKGIKQQKEELTNAIKAAYVAYEQNIADLDKQAAEMYEAFKASQAKSG